MAFADRIINENDVSEDYSWNDASEDDSWTWPPVQPGQLSCILCGKLITFLHGSTKEFFQHVEIEHKIYINHGLLLSIIFLDNETLNYIRERFRKNLNGLKNDLEESFVSDDKDVNEDGSLTDDWDEFDEDRMCHDFTKVLEQNEEETSIARKENFCDKLIEGNEELEDVTKYKPGPKSYKIKQVLKNKQDRILLKLDNSTLRESEKYDDFIKNVKNIFESDIDNDKGANLAQHIRPTKHVNNSETKTNEALALTNIKPSNHVNLNKAESVEAKLEKIHTLESSGQDDQFKPYKLGPKSRKNKRKLKDDSNEILKIKKEIEDDVNSPNYNFLENDWSKLDNQFKRQKISEPNSNVSNMIDEIKHIEEEMKNILYFDILNRDNEKDVKSKKLKRSVKSRKQRKASTKDGPSSKCESDESNSPYPEEINDKMYNVLRYDEEIDFKDLNPRNSKKSEQCGINVEISEYFQQRPNQLSGYNISESLKSQFVFDESLPNGWKFRKIWRENKKLYDIDYLSPDGRKARSKVAVIEYMKLMGCYSLQDYDKIIQNYQLNHYKIFT